MIGEFGALNSTSMFSWPKVAVNTIRSLQGPWEGRYFSDISPDKALALSITAAEFAQSSAWDSPAG